MNDAASSPSEARRLGPVLGSRRLGVDLENDDLMQTVPRFAHHAAFVTRGMGAGLVTDGLGLVRREEGTDLALLDAADAAGEAVLTEAVGVKLRGEEWAAATAAVLGAVRAARAVAAALAAEAGPGWEGRDTPVALGSDDEGGGPAPVRVVPDEQSRAVVALHLQSGRSPSGVRSLMAEQLVRELGVVVKTLSAACVRGSPPQLGRSGPWGLVLTFTGRKFRHGVPVAWRAPITAPPAQPGTADAAATEEGAKEGQAAAATEAGPSDKAATADDGGDDDDDELEAGAEGRAAKRARDTAEAAAAAPAPPKDELEEWEEEVEPITAVLQRAMTSTRRPKGSPAPLIVGRLLRVQHPHSFAAPGADAAWPLVMTFEVADSSGAVRVSCWNAAAAGAWAVLRDAPLGSLVAVRAQRIKDASDRRLFAHARHAAIGRLEGQAAGDEVGASVPEVAVNRWPAAGTDAADDMGGGTRACPVMRVRQCAHAPDDGRGSLLFRASKPAAAREAAASLLASFVPRFGTLLQQARDALGTSSGDVIVRTAERQLLAELSCEPGRIEEQARAVAGLAPEGTPWAVEVAAVALRCVAASLEVQDKGSGGSLLRSRLPRVRIRMSGLAELDAADHGREVSVAGIVTHVGEPYTVCEGDDVAVRAVAALPDPELPAVDEESEDEGEAKEDDEEEDDDEATAGRSRAASTRRGRRGKPAKGKKAPKAEGKKAGKKAPKAEGKKAGPKGKGVGNKTRDTPAEPVATELPLDSIDPAAVMLAVPEAGRRAAARALSALADGRFALQQPLAALAVRASRAGSDALTSASSSSSSSSSSTLGAPAAEPSPSPADGRMRKLRWVRLRDASGREAAVRLDVAARHTGADPIRVGNAVVLTALRVCRPPATDAGDEADSASYAAAALVASAEFGDGTADDAALPPGDAEMVAEARDRSAAPDRRCLVLASTSATDVVGEEELRRPTGRRRPHPGSDGWLSRAPVPGLVLAPDGADELGGMDGPLDDDPDGVTAFVDRALAGTAGHAVTVVEAVAAATVEACRREGLLPAPEAFARGPAPPSYEPWRTHWGSGLARAEWAQAAAEAVDADAIRGLCLALGMADDADDAEAGTLDASGLVRGAPPTPPARLSEEEEEAAAAAGDGGGPPKARTRSRRRRRRRDDPEDVAPSQGEVPAVPAYGDPALRSEKLTFREPCHVAASMLLDGVRVRLPPGSADGASLVAAVALARRYVRDAVVGQLLTEVTRHAEAAVAGEAGARGAGDDGARAGASNDAAAAASSSSSSSSAAAPAEDAQATQRAPQGEEVRDEDDADASGEGDSVPAAKALEAAAVAALRRATERRVAHAEHVLRATAARSAFAVYSAAAARLRGLASEDAPSARRHPRIQGWAAMAGSVALDSAGMSSSAPLLLPPLSAVPRLSVAAALRLASVMRQGQAARFVLAARPIDFVRSSAVTSAIRRATHMALRGSLAGVMVPAAQDLEAGSALPEAPAPSPAAAAAPSEGAAAAEKEAAEGEPAPKRTKAPGTPAGPRTRARSRRRGLTQVDSNVAPRAADASSSSGAAPKRGGKARRGRAASSSSSGAAPSPAPPAGAAAAPFLTALADVIERWLPWADVRASLLESGTWAAAVAGPASQLSLSDIFLPGVIGREFEDAAVGWASAVSGGDIASLRELSSACKRRLRDPVRAAVLRSGIDDSAVPGLKASSRSVRLIKVFVAIAVWAVGADSWERGLAGRFARHDLLGVRPSKGKRSTFKVRLRRAVASTRPASEPLPELEAAPAPAAPAEEPAAAAASSSSSASSAAAAGPAPQPAAEAPVPLAAAVDAELARLAELDDARLMGDVSPHVDRPQRLCQFRSHDEGWSLVAGAYSDPQADREAAAASGRKVLRPASRSGKVAKKDALAFAAAERRLAGAVATGRFLEVALPRDAGAVCFGSGDASLAELARAGSLPEVVAVLGALCRQDGAARKLSARKWQQALSDPARRMLLCVSMHCTGGLRPAICLLEGVYEEFAGPTPPM